MISPTKIKNRRISAQTRTALKAIFLFSLPLKPVVAAINTGIDPMGLITAKKKIKVAIISFMFSLYLSLLEFPITVRLN